MMLEVELWARAISWRKVFSLFWMCNRRRQTTCQMPNIFIETIDVCPLCAFAHVKLDCWKNLCAFLCRSVVAQHDVFSAPSAHGVDKIGARKVGKWSACMDETDRIMNCVLDVVVVTSGQTILCVMRMDRIESASDISFWCLVLNATLCHVEDAPNCTGSVNIRPPRWWHKWSTTNTLGLHIQSVIQNEILCIRDFSYEHCNVPPFHYLLLCENRWFSHWFSVALFRWWPFGIGILFFNFDDRRSTRAKLINKSHVNERKAVVN